MYGVPEYQIDAVIEIARHIRDEAAQKLDVSFDEKALAAKPVETKQPEGEVCGCSVTPGGLNCC